MHFLLPAQFLQVVGDRVLGVATVTFVGPSLEKVHNNVRRDFQALLKRAGLPKVRFHDLRHTHATFLLTQGIHPKIVSERLGHSNISITLDTYSHVLPEMQKEAAAKIDGMLRRKSAP